MGPTFLLSLLVMLANPTHTRADDTPSWTRAAARTVDNGYIVYVGSSEDGSSDRARFKAEAVALQDLANECSFAPKGTRVEDHYDTEENRQHHAFAKVGVMFEDCEDAKKAVQPADIQRLASPGFTDQIKRYQAMIDEAPPEDEGDQEGVNPAVKDGAPPPPPDANGTWRAQRVVVIGSPVEYIYVRQWVAWQKQSVILAPPAAYPVGAPATQTFVQSVSPATAKLQTYERANPGVKHWDRSWSRVPHGPAVSRVHHTSVRPQQRQMRRPSQPNRGAKRRRRDERWR